MKLKVALIRSFMSLWILFSSTVFLNLQIFGNFYLMFWVWLS